MHKQFYSFSKIAVVLILFVSLFPLPSQAQVSTGRIIRLIGGICLGCTSLPASGGGSSYTGPIDVVASPTAIYALRAASAAIAAAGTQKIVNVSASGTTPANVTCDIIVASDGGLGKNRQLLYGKLQRRGRRDVLRDGKRELRRRDVVRSERQWIRSGRTITGTGFDVQLHRLIAVHHVLWSRNRLSLQQHFVPDTPAAADRGDLI